MGTNFTIYGVDLGTGNVSISAVAGTGVSTYHLKFNPASRPFDIHETIREFIDPIEPRGMVFIEGIFKGPSMRTYERMTRVAHSLDVVFGEHHCSTEYVNATSWRKTLFSDSRIKKELAQKWVIEQYPILLHTPAGERGHRADALCVALAGGIKSGVLRKDETGGYVHL